MRLRTHISKQTGSWVTAVEIHSHLVTAINHDAMVAHALTQALSEARNQCHGSWDTCDFIAERAGEIMASWGYRED